MLRRTLLIALFLTSGFLAGLVLTGRMPGADESTASPPPVQREASPQPRPGALPHGLPDLTGIAERAVRAVTSISSTQIIRNASPFADDPFFRRFFGDDLFGPQRAQSLGSGVVVSPDGYVLTNAHVVGSDRGEVSEVSVILPDKRELRARIIGTDEMVDLAVLKISAGQQLPTLPWGDSSKLRIAEWVLAIGNPFGVFNQSVTLGIVSATGRTVEGLGMETFIQTDAAINKGNSGGALINARGELVGINTAIYSETGGYQGIGLAVPSNVARRTLDELIKTGSVRRGTIAGILLRPLTSEWATRLGAPDTNGVLVIEVDPRAPAADAGLRNGDVITAINGTTIEGASHFMRLVSEAKIGSSVTLSVIRDGRQGSVRVPIDQARSGRRRR